MNLTLKTIGGALVIILFAGALYVFVFNDQTQEEARSVSEEKTLAPPPQIPEDIQEHIHSKRNYIRVDSPEPLETISSPVEIKGEARGTWLFEATFPLVIVDWDGRIIGEGIASTTQNWMTDEFVSFSGTVSFEKPEDVYSEKGTLILQKANASGLLEYEDALEIPIRLE